ncbi:MAG: 3-hydroxybutyryl-CoA dehydrogenase [Bdellovibrionales bacterium]|nr:3-hydroxybutyryl-CoA dehydrogenase [Bdellovibrionales bacterium]
MQETIGIVGAGTMGCGIAQLAAQHGHPVHLYETDTASAATASERIAGVVDRLVTKGALTKKAAQELLGRIQVCRSIEELEPCSLVLEAISENLSAKQELFESLSDVCAPSCLFATNTSSLSVAAIAAEATNPERVLGLHFFNPAPVLPLVEIIPTDHTTQEVVKRAETLVRRWGKTTVRAKDTPGFIVNRIARPFYGEALRILEEGIADVATIDSAMRERSGFRMGPFQLMDLIGIDVNLTVTETFYRAMGCDPRYEPSKLQAALVAKGHLGRKTEVGFYDYRTGAVELQPSADSALQLNISERIVAMILNEAAEARRAGVASVEDIDTAMVKGANYPRGPLEWIRQIGPATVLAQINALRAQYNTERYRPSPLLETWPTDSHPT